MKGKGLYLWQVKLVLGGNPSAIAKRAKQMRLSHVIVKAADGTGRYNLRTPLMTDDIIGPLIAELAAVGIPTFGFHFIYGNQPEAEADRAIERINKYKFAGWVVNAEGHFEAAGKGVAATKYMARLRANTPTTLPIGLTTFRFHKNHEAFPWRQFFEWIDFHQPQVYWQAAHNPAVQLETSLAQYRALEKSYGMSPKPYYPIGAAYHEHGWQPTIPEIIQFDAKAKDLGLQSVSFWEWGHAVRYGFEETIANIRWPGDEPLTLEQRVQDLERRVGALEGKA